MLHDFVLRGKKVKIWQRVGESYEHILMKALAFALFIDEYPDLQIETSVNLRFKPDLIVWDGDREFQLWVECGANSLRKTAWILKHTQTKKLVLLKIGQNSEQLVKQLREIIPAKNRQTERLILINFVTSIADLTVSKQIEKVSSNWYSKTIV